ncbi:hypothetical protein BASA83_002614 [Batrachochytrium salamandrivorans]|nr:hypothetical protein BASA83_002614 [Batrachochytrium salamandrivorans]
MRSDWDAISARTSATAHTTPTTTVASTLTSASVLKVAATAVAAAVTTVAAAAASSHSSARRRFKATGISGTQHAVSIAAGAALAANDHSADSDRSVTGLMTQMASASTLGATSRTPQPTLVAKVANQNQLVGDANTTKGAFSDAKKENRRGRTKKPALISTESANEDADEKTLQLWLFLGGGSGTLSSPRRGPRRGSWQ